jgi:hypothetical protein
VRYSLDVMNDQHRLSRGVVRKLEKTTFFNSVELQRIWDAFIGPSPWQIVVEGCIRSVAHFTRAFAACVATPAQMMSWRGHGLLSMAGITSGASPIPGGGVFGRIFAMLDTHQHVWRLRSFRDGSMFILSIVMIGCGRF